MAGKKILFTLDPFQLTQYPFSSIGHLGCGFAVHQSGLISHSWEGGKGKKERGAREGEERRGDVDEGGRGKRRKARQVGERREGKRKEGRDKVRRERFHHQTQLRTCNAHLQTCTCTCTYMLLYTCKTVCVEGLLVNCVLLG